MRTAKELRKEIIDKEWSLHPADPKRLLEFHRYLEDTIKQDRIDLLNEITSEIVHKCDSFSDCMNLLTDFKIK